MPRHRRAACARGRCRDGGRARPRPRCAGRAARAGSALEGVAGHTGLGSARQIVPARSGRRAKVSRRRRAARRPAAGGRLRELAQHGRGIARDRRDQLLPARGGASRGPGGRGAAARGRACRRAAPRRCDEQPFARDCGWPRSPCVPPRALRDAGFRAPRIHGLAPGPVRSRRRRPGPFLQAPTPTTVSNTREPPNRISFTCAGAVPVPGRVSASGTRSGPRSPNASAAPSPPAAEPTPRSALC